MLSCRGEHEIATGRIVGQGKIFWKEVCGVEEEIAGSMCRDAIQ